MTRDFPKSAVIGWTGFYFHFFRSRFSKVKGLGLWVSKVSWSRWYSLWVKFCEKMEHLEKHDLIVVSHSVLEVVVNKCTDETYTFYIPRLLIQVDLFICDFSNFCPPRFLKELWLLCLKIIDAEAVWEHCHESWSSDSIWLLCLGLIHFTFFFS